MSELDGAHVLHVMNELGVRLSANVVVGVSGGVDSVVLLQLLCDAGFSVTACHANYGLRGAESESDETFVRALADELGLHLVVKRIDLPESGNRQEAARDARYAFFRETAEAVGAEVVVVAHHCDDQAETVLLNLFRGAGAHGLSGMPTIRPIARSSSIQLIRPLLGWSREDIEELARTRGWDWREDSSNTSGNYARNRLRNYVIPLIQKEFGERASRNIAEAAGRIRAVVDLVDGSTSVRLSIDELRALPEAQRHFRYVSALKRFAPHAPLRSGAMPDLDALLDAQPGKRVVWPGVSVWREREALVIKPEGENVALQSWRVQMGSSATTPFGTLAVELVENIEPEDLKTTNGEIELVDAAALLGPLSLRCWRAGDRFSPLSLNGSKLVSDLLTDHKVPSSERDRQLVLCSGEEIVWVVGRRLAEEARIRASTEQAVRLVWTPAPAFG